MTLNLEVWTREEIEGGGARLCCRKQRDGSRGCGRPAHAGACPRKRSLESSTTVAASSLHSDAAASYLASMTTSNVDATCQVSFETVINMADAVVNGLYGSPGTVDSIPDFKSFYLSLVEKRGDTYFCPCGYSYQRSDWQSHGKPTHMWKGKRGHCKACVERFNAATTPLDGTASVVQLQKMVEAQRGVIRSLQDEKAALLTENAQLRSTRGPVTVTNNITNNITINMPPYATIVNGTAVRQKADRLDEKTSKIRGIITELDCGGAEPTAVVPWYVMEKYFAGEPNFKMPNRSKMEVAEAVVEDENGQRSWKPVDGKAALNEYIEEAVKDLRRLNYSTSQYEDWADNMMPYQNVGEGGFHPKRVYNTEHADHKHMMKCLHTDIYGISRPK
jgi:hypothetical protein